jgi:TRAP-type C4-dicarboxylate transport system permease small subunit
VDSQVAAPRPVEPVDPDFEDVPLWPHDLRVRAQAFHPRWLTWLNRFIEIATGGLKYVAVACLALLLLDVSASVVLRYVFNSPLTWSETVALWFLIWMTFAGAPYPLAQGTHYTVETFPKSLSRPAQIGLALVATALSLVFCLVVLWYGVSLTITNLRQMAPVLNLPYAVPYASIPLGFFLMGLILVRDLVELGLNFSPAVRRAPAPEIEPTVPGVVPT